jgi:hypothetical protein
MLQISGSGGFIEHVYNPSFEIDGTFVDTFDGWDGGAIPNYDYYNSGVRGCWIYESQLYNIEDYSVPVDDIAEIGFYFLSVGLSQASLSVYIIYSDDSESSTGVIESPTPLVWTYISLKDYLVAGKTIKRLWFFGGSSTAFPVIDDVTITTGSLTTLEVDPITWEEEQSCKVAIRDIPTRVKGAHVDTGTYVLNPRNLNITFRITEAQRSTLVSLFGESSIVNLISDDGSGLWYYSCWIDGYPHIYEYNKTSTEERFWKVDLKLISRSIDYIGPSYDEPENTITINGIYYKTVIDFSLGITNKMCNDEQFVNNSNVEFDLTVWSKSPYRFTYVIRTSSAGKLLLDQLIEAHNIVTLTDVSYYIDEEDTWIEEVNETWEGDINWNKPWKIEITMLLINA